MINIKKNFLLLVLAFILLLIVIGLLIYYRKNISINTFEECLKANNKIVNTQPKQCQTITGKMFTEKLSPMPKPFPSKENINQKNVVCTMDVKLCPDGSYVGRIPPSCSFSACPNSK